MLALTMISRSSPKSYVERKLDRKTLSDEFKEAEMRGIQQAKKEMHDNGHYVVDSHNYPKGAGSCAIQ